MIEFKKKVFSGSWRAISSNEYQFGTLEINSNGDSKLSVTGMFPKEWNVLNNIPETLIGNFVETESRNCFTIILYKNIGYTRTSSELNNYSLLYKFTLIGDKVGEEKIRDLSFNEIMVSSDSFQKNVLTDDIEINHNPSEDWINYRLKFAPSYEIFKDDFQKVYIWWRSTFPLTNSHKIILQRPSWLNISFTEFISIEYCFEQKNKIEQFFTFLNKQHVSFEYLDVHHICGLTFKVIGIKKSIDWGVKRQYLNILDGNPFETYRNWLNIYEKIGFATDTFHNALINRELSVQNKFLAFCFSLELFHREFYVKFEPLEKRNSEIISKITYQLKGKGDLETWFKKFVSTKKEITFKNRILDLLNDTDLILNFDFDIYSDKIRDTRNKLVHLEESEKNPFSNEELIQNIKIISDLFIDHLNKKIMRFETNDDHEKIRLNI